MFHQNGNFCDELRHKTTKNNSCCNEFFVFIVGQNAAVNFRWNDFLLVNFFSFPCVLIPIIRNYSIFLGNPATCLGRNNCFHKHFIFFCAYSMCSVDYHMHSGKLMHVAFLAVSVQIKKDISEYCTYLFYTRL